MFCVPEKEISRATYNDTYASLQQEHPEWEPHDLRIHTAEHLLPKNLIDQETARRENQGLALYEVPEATFTVTESGVVWYPKYGSGVGLVDLSARQKEIMPEKYSPEEHATSLLIENQFKEGATKLATSYGGRDIVIMEYDPTTKIGKTTMLNTAVMQEAQGKTLQAFMQAYFPALASVFVSDSVFLFSDKALSLSRAKEIVQPVLKDVGVAPKKQFVQSHQQVYAGEQTQESAYMPLPFLSFASADAQATIVEDSVFETPSVPAMVMQEKTRKQVVMNEQHVKNTRVAEKEQKITKVVEEKIENSFLSQQENSSVVTVLFQYQETHKQSEQIQQIAPRTLDENVSDKKVREVLLADDAVIVQNTQKESERRQDDYVGNWTPSIQEFQIDVSDYVTDGSVLMQETQRTTVAVASHEDTVKDVVVQETLEEYFSANVQESVVEIAPAEVSRLCVDTKKEEVHEVEQAPKEVKKVRKLCWIMPLTEYTVEPEMLEVEMPKDQNQRLYNLLHFLRKVIKAQFGEDTIRVRHTQVMQADIQEANIDEIEYYLSLLEQRNTRAHLFALVS